MSLRPRALLGILLAFGLATAGDAQRRPRTPAPAAAPRQAQVFVAAAHPLATEAGLAVLRRGGSAVDAAIAVQAMLSLVEPQSSGLGGGAFMTYYDGATKMVTVYDGRETAPAGATPDMFLDDNGRPLPRGQAMTGGRATGVPGVLAMLDMAHHAHGRLQWRDLFGEAQHTAEQGFRVTPRLARFANGSFPQSRTDDVARYFSQRPDGGRVQAGDTLRNPAYAAFLRRLAAEGTAAFYRGPTAQRIVERTRAAPLAGTMTLEDLANYRPVRREPICRTWRVLLVCAPPPPASGVGLLQLLAILERTDIASRGPEDPQAWYLFAEASRIMYADRDHFVGDPAFFAVPVEGLLNADYVASRARLIGERAGPPPTPGAPPAAPTAAADRTFEPAGTTHFVIVDAAGNAVSMTTTVESIFGSGRMVDGFFLNNQMTDFGFDPRAASANAVAPGKRPRSSMTPLILLYPADRSLAGALGSPGGNAIPAYVAKTMIGRVDWRLSTQAAIDLPNLVARGAAFNGEAGRMSEPLRTALAWRGVEVVAGSGEDSGLHGVWLTPQGFDGGADQRREGVARSETVTVAPPSPPDRRRRRVRR
jgi:gamma-glutamyltranspeptidase/glutathione hydrolase